MKCPLCMEEGERSTVTEGISTVTAMHCAPFYDEEGLRHHHDLNTTRTEYSCSRGHEFFTNSQPSCPTPGCDHKGSDEMFVVRTGPDGQRAVHRVGEGAWLTCR